MRPVSLRMVVGVVVVLLGGVSATTSGSLLLLTSWLTEASVRLEQHVESVSVTVHAVRDLVLHARASDPIVRAELGERLRADMQAVHALAVGPDDGAAVTAAESAVVAYLSAGADADAYDRAYETLDDLAALNVAQAHVARAEAVRWDRIGTWMGLASAVAVPGVLLLTLVWLERSITPVFRIGESLDRYAAGDRDVRAPEVGPAELRRIAAAFNGLASALARQRETQLTFLAGVAHDLRNPLMALRLATRLVRPDGPLPDEGTLRVVVDTVRRQVDHLDRMVGDLLDETRILSGRLALELAEHDLRSIAREVVDLISGASPGHHIALRVPDGPVTLRCDATRIGQALTNLVGNAVKYSPPGEVSVTVEVEAGEASVAVTDRGPGIAPADQAAIFEPFRRGPGRDDTEGTGLGLFVSRRIVEAHGGRLELTSEPGAGSTFRIRVPLPA